MYCINCRSHWCIHEKSNPCYITQVLIPSYPFPWYDFFQCLGKLFFQQFAIPENNNEEWCRNVTVSINFTLSIQYQQLSFYISLQKQTNKQQQKQNKNQKAINNMKTIECLLIVNQFCESFNYFIALHTSVCIFVGRCTLFFVGWCIWTNEIACCLRLHMMMTIVNENYVIITRHGMTK